VDSLLTGEENLALMADVVRSTGGGQRRIAELLDRPGLLDLDLVDTYSLRGADEPGPRPPRDAKTVWYIIR
jgi:hypothetical protein